MNIPNIVEKIKKNYVPKKVPCNSNRASSMGYFCPSLGGCVRRGVYQRTAWERAEEWDVDSLIRFEEGNRQERLVMRDLIDAGFDPIEQQISFSWREYNITGHLDAVILVDGNPVPIEIKSMSPFIFDQVWTIDDFDKYPWTKAYKAQLTLYMLEKNIDLGIWLLKDKSSGLMKQINFPLDYELGEDCLKTAETINKHVAAGTIPNRIENREVCKKCPFKHFCLPDIDFGEPLKIVDDPDFEQRLEKALQLKEQKQEYEKLWKICTEEMKAQSNDGDLNILIGNYRITADGSKTQFRPKIELL